MRMTTEEAFVKVLQRHGIEPALVSYPVQRSAEIGRRVGERAIEIEQHGLDWQDARCARIGDGPGGARCRGGEFGRVPRVKRHGETPSCN